MRVSEIADAQLFEGLSTAELQSLAKRTVIRKFSRNAVILKEGDATGAVYVIGSGRVRVFVAGEDGREITLCTLGKGEHFGELALIDDQPHSASVAAVERCEVVVIHREAFQALLAAHPDKMMALLRVLAQRLRRLTYLTRDLALVDVYGRIVAMLLAASSIENNERIIREKLTHQEIAQRVGASREMVSRIMKDLADGGYIKNTEDALVICKPMPHGW